MSLITPVEGMGTLVGLTTLCITYLDVLGSELHAGALRFTFLKLEVLRFVLLEGTLEFSFLVLTDLESELLKGTIWFTFKTLGIECISYLALGIEHGIKGLTLSPNDFGHIVIKHYKIS